MWRDFAWAFILEIIPETFSSYEIIGPILGIAIGILVMSLLDNYCHHQ